jgi:hypothetical protein
MLNNKEGKKTHFNPEQGMKPRRGVEVQRYSFFNFGVRWDWWLIPHPGRLIPGKGFGTHFSLFFIHGSCSSTQLALWQNNVLQSLNLHPSHPPRLDHPNHTNYINNGPIPVAAWSKA